MTEKISRRDVELFTQKKLERLLKSKKESTRIFAELRRGIGKAPGEVPQLWGYFLEGMPEKFYGQHGPSRAEWAVYVALTLFALHSQGNDPEKIYLERQSLGTAMTKLIHSDDDRERIIRRFNIIVTANSLEELSHYLRGAVQFLRGDNIALDYAKLAGDIYAFQFPQWVSNVRLTWGHDFYRNKKQDNEEVVE